MAIQMEEYACAKVLSYFRRMDEYRQLQSQRQWKQLPAYQHEDFVIGVMGAGIRASGCKTLSQLWFSCKNMESL